MKVITICSGGMDSVTLAYDIADAGHAQELVSFDYGQRHAKEIRSAALAAGHLGCPHTVVDLRALAPLLSGSALTDADVAVPLGHYADETMRATVVPNRNAIMLSVAAGIAVARGAYSVALGIHAGDHPIYPDCRPAFVDAMNTALQLATEGFAVEGFGLMAPFVNLTKADIVRIGDTLGVPYGETWSCYQGGKHHCGQCGTCVERREAFALAEVDDPTLYYAEGGIVTAPPSLAG
jgi:7-cyano-7-deazaguanine synthase